MSAGPMASDSLLQPRSLGIRQPRRPDSKGRLVRYLKLKPWVINSSRSRSGLGGRWTLPGGWADVNESPKEAVVREIREESGYETIATKLLAVYDRSQHGHEPAFPFHVYKLFILCGLIGGESATSSETSDVGFFAEEALPELSHSRVTVSQIKRFFEYHREHDLPTDFD